MPSSDRLRRGNVLRGVALTTLAAALVVVGMLLGWRLAGPSIAETAIGRVAFELRPSLTGEAEAFIPVADWGFRADAFDAPFEITAELRSLERPALLEAAEGDLSVLETIEQELRDGARSAVLRGFAVGLAVSLGLLALATLVWRELRPRWALAGLGAALALAAGGASLWMAQATFDARSFETPTYFARGGELRRILEVAENERVRSEYGSTFANILRSISTVLAEEPGLQEPGRDLYLASDLHANALVIGPFARAIDDAPLLLAGDFGQRGGEIEAAGLAPRVATLSGRVVAVSGNHDSRRLMSRLASEGVAVLGDRGVLDPSGVYEGSPLIEVDGLVLAGFPDPLEWQGTSDPDSRPVTFDDLPDGEASFERAASELIAWFDDLPASPDIVMIHQFGLAERLAEALLERDYARDLTIVAGHDHDQHVDRYGSVIVVDGGSVGAGGIFDAGEEPIGFAELHFAADQPALRSVDLIAIEPFSGQARASRVVVRALCPDEDRCRFEPSGLEASPPE